MTTALSSGSNSMNRGGASSEVTVETFNEPTEMGKKSVSSLNSLKYFSLVALILQNAALILVMRYTRTQHGDLYLSTTAVVMSEICKLLTCCVIIIYQEGGVNQFIKLLKTDIIDCPVDCVKVSIPSIIYTIQNNLLYLAVSNLDAATFQVTYQLKILTTAIFSVFMLDKALAKLQWLSLVVLFVGVSIVQLQPKTEDESVAPTVEQSPAIGLGAVIISCVLSGFAGVYFEKILKGTRQSVWIRNIQLSVLGVVIGLITMEVKDGTKVSDKGFFFGYTWFVWLVIFLQSFGGLIVAVVVKYADNILKGFATSASIILSCIISVYFFNFHLSLQFVIGALLVMIAVYMYGKFVPQPKPLV